MAQSKSAKRMKRKTKKGRVFLKGLIMIAVVVGLSWFVKLEIDVISDTMKNKNKINELNAEYEQVIINCEEKKSIKDSIEAGDDSDEKIIKIVRSRGYVYPDEKVFIDIAGN